VARKHPPLQAPESVTLIDWLEYHRQTLLWKCQGLSDDELRSAPVLASNLSLIGLIRHMTDVEGVWFRDFVGEVPEHSYRTQDRPDASFEDAHSADISSAFAGWRAECTRSREIVAAAPSLDATSDHDNYSLRWIITFVIQEYARHNGHADLIRQSIDGATGV
jgi:uncharacterized damage-inducible protein DinB